MIETRPLRSTGFADIGAGALAALFIVALLSPATNAAQRVSNVLDAPFFIAPGSGQKVSSYTVTLPIRKGDGTFEVPGDCDAISELVASNKADRSRILNRRLWLKAEHDCRHYVLLNRHPRTDLEDHVSQHDFFNLRFDALPFDQRCDDSIPSQCSLWLRGVTGSMQQLSPDLDDEQLENCEPSRARCGLSNGYFRGHIMAMADGVACVPDRRASFRLLSVDYGDVNGDGVLDAVLRLMHISPKKRRQIFNIPVTRLGPDEALISPTPTSD